MYCCCLLSKWWPFLFSNRHRWNFRESFAQTGELVDRILVTYAAGSCAWRLIDSVSQITLRTGFGYKVGATGPGPYEGKIGPITIGQNMVLEVYTAAVA